MRLAPRRRQRGRARSATLAFVVVGCVGYAPGCGGSQPTTPPRDARGGGEPPMHAPPASAPSDQPQLGTLQPVAVPEHSEPTATPSATPAAAPVAPIRIARSPAPRPYPLRDRDLVLSSGAVVHNLPRGVAVRAVLELGSEEPVLEFVDPRGHRLALLKETPLSRVALGSGPSLLEATTATRVRSQRDDWGKSRTDVVIDRFQSDTHLYTLERRSSGTDWLMSGLELASHH